MTQKSPHMLLDGYIGKNVLGYLRKREIFQHQPIKQDKEFILQMPKFDILRERHKEKLLSLISSLEEISVSWYLIVDEATKIFWILSEGLKNLTGIKDDLYFINRHIIASELTDELRFKTWMLAFDFCGGVKLLKRFIMSYSLLPEKAARERECSVILELQRTALEVYHAFCVEFESIAKASGDDKNFVECLFSYMQYSQSRFQACKVLECLLVSHGKIFDLSTIENLQNLVTNYDEISLAYFCKILTVTTSELDIYEHKTSLYFQTKEAKGDNYFIRDKNQDIILKIPNILSRIVDIACKKPFVPKFPNIEIESEHWREWIERQVFERINDHKIAYQRLVLTEMGISRCEVNIESAYGVEKSIFKITSEFVFRADAACALGLLLVGRHRNDVQRQLTELCLIPQLCDLFDQFKWRSSNVEHHRLPGHNSSCECSPEVALKVQVLKLIHSFCDHSDYKHSMLSWSELSELQASDEDNGDPLPEWIRQELLCHGSKGLLSRIVEIMDGENGASTFRFWLSRAVESYLRGSNNCLDQNFLLKRNLLEHVFKHLIGSNPRNKEVLQSSFDLLGELVKFNSSAFHKLNKLLSTTAKRKKLTTLVNQSLVDSNMFIRSIILSYEMFTTSKDADLREFAETDCYPFSSIKSATERVFFLQKVLSVINAHNLTQENISCLNTALVILIFGLRKGELPHYLDCLVSPQPGCSLTPIENALMLDNLSELLSFWQEHDLQTNKDSTILERSSRIPFEEWLTTASTIIQNDAKNPNTIAYHSIPSVFSRAF